LGNHVQGGGSEAQGRLDLGATSSIG
jgi:hypothetical protein